MSVGLCLLALLQILQEVGGGGGADETDGGSSDIWTNLIFLDIAEAFELCLVIRKTHFESKSSD